MKSNGQKLNFKMNIMNGEIFIPIIVFAGTYYIIKLISEHLLKRKIIKAGHIDKAGILEPPPKISDEEVNKYPSLKWGLVVFFAGLGLILIEVMRQINPNLVNRFDATLPIGILLVFISFGFLIYFFIMNMRKKR